jgi:uncharacterized damage-inducible protein DinB
MGKRSDALADQFEKAVDELAKTIDACSDAQWQAKCGAEGWSVASTAQHVSGQFPLEMEFITAAAEGKTMPGYSWDDINGKNDGRAEKNKDVSRADVLRELREGAKSTAAYIRGLSDEQLDRTGKLGLAGGADVSAEQLIMGGVLIEHVTGHLQSIRTAG